MTEPLILPAPTLRVVSPKMNPAIKAQWVAALRSGTYSQVRGYLSSASGMCCLGVLCDLAKQAQIGDWVPEVEYDDNEGITELKEYRSFFEENNYEVPPEPVAAFAGFIDTTNPYVRINADFAERCGVQQLGRLGDISTDGYFIIDLATLNDNGIPFSVIADLIEEQL